ncbi:MAG TPA: hypothetical protein VNO14_19195 [Blastocatellia bacterium]|nr:hypothetical protein [Blastocatellia bacterium]
MVSKAIKGLAVAMVLGMVLGAAGQAAGQTVTRDLVMTRDAKVGDKSVSKGKYSISFDNEKDGELSLMKNGKEVARVSYKLVDLGKDAESSVVVFAIDGDGTLSVRRIEIKGAKMALELD